MNIGEYSPIFASLRYNYSGDYRTTSQMEIFFVVRQQFLMATESCLQGQQTISLAKTSVFPPD